MEFNNNIRTIKGNAPIILSIISIIGLATTTLFAINATAKSTKLLDSDWKNYGPDPDSNGDDFSLKYKAKRCWKYYIPTVISAGATVSSIVIGTKISMDRIKGLTAAYTIAQSTATAAQQKMLDVVGKTKRDSINGEVGKELLEQYPQSQHNTYYPTGKASDNLIFDYMSGRYFYMDQAELDKIINELSERIRTENYICLNEFYTEIGLSPVGLGDDVGFRVDDTKGGNIDIAFYPELDNDRKVVTIMKPNTSLRFDYAILH